MCSTNRFFFFSSWQPAVNRWKRASRPVWNVAGRVQPGPQSSQSYPNAMSADITTSLRDILVRHPNGKWVRFFNFFFFSSFLDVQSFQFVLKIAVLVLQVTNDCECSYSVMWFDIVLEILTFSFRQLRALDYYSLFAKLLVISDVVKGYSIAIASDTG